MRPWQFRQKTPGFGISPEWYDSVLSGTAVLPSILHVVNPDGEGGAVEGYGAPLAAGASKDDLARPMARGKYVVASKDRKTVIKVMVVPKDEAGFDPAPVLASKFASTLSPEVLARISATWSLVQLTFETHHPMVYDSVRFMLRLGQRLAQLTEGVIADPVAQTYRLPEEVFQNPQAHPLIDARDVIAVHSRQKPEGIWVYTMGMRKFGMPELEIGMVEPVQEGAAGRFLESLAQKALLGDKIEMGDQVGAKPFLFQVAMGGLDRGQWEGVPVFELLPPTGRSAGEVLANWSNQNR